MAPETRATTIAEKLEREGAKALEFFGGLDEAGWRTPCHGDDAAAWTVRDVLEHFVNAELEFLDMFSAIAAGTGSGAPEGFDVNAFNSKRRGSMAALTTAQLIAQFKSARTAMIAFALSLRDDQLDLPGRHPALGPSTLDAMLRLVALHNAGHLRDIRKTLGAR